MDEAEEKQVGRDVVRADVGGGGDVDFVGGVEGPCVDELQDKQDNPVDACDDGGLRKGCWVVVFPDAAVGMVAFVRPVEGVVECRDEEQEVADRSGDLVGQDSLRGELLPAGKGVARTRR